MQDVKPLTPRQQQAYEVIFRHYCHGHGLMTAKRFCEEMGHRSPNAWTQIVHVLVRKGYMSKGGHGDYHFIHAPNGRLVLGFKPIFEGKK
jgi:hypothetical protein